MDVPGSSSVTPASPPAPSDRPGRCMRKPKAPTALTTVTWTREAPRNVDLAHKDKKKLSQKGSRTTVIGKNSANKRAVNPAPRGTRRERERPKQNAARVPSASRNRDLALRKQEQDRLDRDSATKRRLGWARFFLAPCFLVFLAFMPPHAQLAIALILGILRKDLGAMMHDVS